MSLTLKEIYIFINKINIRIDNEHSLNAKLHGFKVKNQFNKDDFFIDDEAFDKTKKIREQRYKENFG